jgi:hypothetical protein
MFNTPASTPHKKSPKNTLFCVLAIFSSRILALAKANTADKPIGLSRGSTQDKAKFAAQNRVRIIFIWLSISKKRKMYSVLLYKFGKTEYNDKK